MEKSVADEIISLLGREYPSAKPQLEYSSAFELLVAVILSAQCTDVRVNMVTRELFKEWNTPEKILALGETALGEIIKPCGLYKNKASHIVASAKKIIERFGGEVPSTVDELMELDGVGRKTANVVYSVWFGGDAIAVDTHVFRLANRIGLARADTPEGVEKGLNAIIDKELWSKSHHYLIYHGRTVCKASRPACESCVIKNLCEKNGVKCK